MTASSDVNILEELTPILILWKGKILGVCDLTLFVDLADTQAVMFELDDKLTPIYTTGALYVMNTLSPQENTDKLLDILTSLYKDITVSLCVKETKNGHIQ